MTDKPIKRNENIAPLSRDHYQGLLFCSRIRKGVKDNLDFGRLVAYMKWFWENDMKMHFNSEEVNLFILTEDELTKQALSEHVIIKEKINYLSITEQPAADDFLELAKLVDNHIRFEERILFPHLEQTIPEDQIIRIGKILLNDEKNHCAIAYLDEFWTKR